ncbi:hypothetical protein BKG82_26790 [Mycobacteroides chelonae]|uniref:Uncharacterized protein n=2 Tax=Mycobacteroides chelonae TaxID=1774 RepID=A0A1S1LC94_MYCCH|nr:hypothetical protein BKG82_26790 [Mycobacteroides chelonae]
MSAGAWDKLRTDIRRLLVLLTAACDLGSGRVELQPDSWARELGITAGRVDECVEFLAGGDLAYWVAGSVETYAVQLPFELRCVTT